MPNHFLFRVSETDAERFRDTQKALRTELEHVVLDGARERGWGLVGPPTVEFEADPDLKEGRFECEASLVEGPTGWTPPVDRAGRRRQRPDRQPRDGRPGTLDRGRRRWQGQDATAWRRTA